MGWFGGGERSKYASCTGHFKRARLKPPVNSLPKIETTRTSHFDTELLLDQACGEFCSRGVLDIGFSICIDAFRMSRGQPGQFHGIMSLQYEARYCFGQLYNY